MDLDQTRETFSAAIRLALVSNASLQERLGSLISSVCELQRDDFPDERVWDDFRRLVNVTARRQPRELVQVTALQMSDKEAAECIQAAFDIYSHVAGASGKTAFSI